MTRRTGPHEVPRPTARASAMRFRQGQAAQRRADLRIVEGIAREYWKQWEACTTRQTLAAAISQSKAIACDLIAARIRATGGKGAKGKGKMAQ